MSKAPPKRTTPHHPAEPPTKLRNAKGPAESLDPVEVESAPEPTVADLRKLSDKVNRGVLVMRALEKLEQEVKAKKSELLVITDTDLPTLFEAAGVTAEFGRVSKGALNGIGYEFKASASASLPVEDAELREQGLNFLYDNNHEDLVQHTLVITFPRGEEKWVQKFMADCAKRKKPLQIERKLTVNPQSLGALVRELITKGKDVPDKALGVFRFKRVKLTPPEEDTLQT